MRLKALKCMTAGEIVEALRGNPRLLHTLRVEDIQRLCRTGLSHDLAKRIWLYSAQRELPLMEECSSTQLTLDLFNDSKEAENGK